MKERVVITSSFLFESEVDKKSVKVQKHLYKQKFQKLDILAEGDIFLKFFLCAN